MRNPYLRDFRDQIRLKFAEDSEQMSMSQWILKNTTLRKKPFSFEGYEFQEQIVDDMSPTMYVIKCSQIGLALALDTPVPTVNGWTTMGDIKAGTQVFDEQGKPCTVTYVSPVYTDRDCYEIEFDTGEIIVADGDHRWYVESDRPFDEEGFHEGRGRPLKHMKREGVIRTRQIAEAVQRDWSTKRNVFAIPTTPPLALPDADLAIDPYVLGLWLGDGNSSSAGFTCHVDDLDSYQELLRPRGYSLDVRSRKDNTLACTIVRAAGTYRHRTHAFAVETASFHGLLTHLDLIRNKHIPERYLRASESQRRDLLRGLLDTDGSATSLKRSCFYNCSETLVRQVEELARSLGFKTTLRWRKPGRGGTHQGQTIQAVQPLGEVSFVSYQEDGAFLLPRKINRLRPRSEGRVSETRRRRIVDVRKVDPVPTRCLTVDSPNHLFLCGKGMIPTHNTETQLRKYAAFLVRNTGVKGIFTLPDDNMFKRVSQTRFKPMIDTDNVFNIGYDKPIRSIPLYQFGLSFGYFVGNKESDATSIDADLLFHDELDLSDQEMIALFQSRLQGSDWRITQNFSTPTFEGFGIDAGYKASDQHEYMCKCEACNHWNIPEYNQHFAVIPGLSSDLQDLIEIDDEMSHRLDLEAAYMRCEKCGNRLNLADPSLRQWVPRYPGRRTRGYQVSPFATPKLDLKYIIEQQLQYKRRDAVRRFYNTVLGKSYNDSNARLSEVDIRAVMDGAAEIAVHDHEPVFVGIDVGQTCHITLYRGGHGQPRAFRFYMVAAENIVDEVEKLLARYNVVGGGMDRYPYTTTSNEVRDLTQGRIMPYEYATTPNAQAVQIIKDELDQVSHIRINRTQAIDQLASAIRKRRVAFSGYGQYDHLIVSHLRDMVRIEKDDLSVLWQKLTGQDHFFHSTTLGLFSMRVAEALHYRSDADNRELVATNGVTVTMQSGADLSMQSRRKTPMSLATL